MAGVLLLETLDSARRRGAPILGEICGFGWNAAATDWLKPDAAGMARAMQQALDQAGWQATQVDYVNAHGTGTRLNDAAEASALQQVFGAHCAQLPVSSTKAMHGHALGASGALETIASLLAMQQQLIPANGRSHQPDPECALDIVHGNSRAAALQRVLSQSFAFGGLHAVLALGSGRSLN